VLRKAHAKQKQAQGSVEILTSHWGSKCGETIQESFFWKISLVQQVVVSIFWMWDRLRKKGLGVICSEDDKDSPVTPKKEAEAFDLILSSMSESNLSTVVTATSPHVIRPLSAKSSLVKCNVSVALTTQGLSNLQGIRHYNASEYQVKKLVLDEFESKAVVTARHIDMESELNPISEDPEIHRVAAWTNKSFAWFVRDQVISQDPEKKTLKFPKRKTTRNIWSKVQVQQCTKSTVTWLKRTAGMGNVTRSLL